MIMANITRESHQHKLSLPEKNNSNTAKNIIHHQEYDPEDDLSFSDLIRKNNDSAADRNQTRSSEKIHDMFEFSSPNYQHNYTKPTTRFAAKSPANIRYLVKQASPSPSPSHNYPMLAKSSSKSSPGKRSVKNSEDWIFQKSKSTSLYHSSPKKHTKGGIEHEYHEEHKVSIFSSPLKSKWLFVLLGLPPKVPPTDAVELKTDIKNRQSRHAPSTFFPSNSTSGGYEEVAAAEGSPRQKASEKRKKSMLVSCFGAGGPVQV